MLSLLSTILSWNDVEREKAGLQRVGGQGNGAKSANADKGKRKDLKGERSAEEEAAMNEVSYVVISLDPLLSASTERSGKGNIKWIRFVPTEVVSSGSIAYFHALT